MIRVKWKAAQSTVQPKETDFTTCPGRVYLAKDIETEEAADANGENPVTYYNYQVAMLTTEEYEEYLADQESPSTTAMMQAVSDLQADIALLSAMLL